MLTPWSAWSRPAAVCGLASSLRNRACVGEGEVVCADLDCGPALYEETRVSKREGFTELDAIQN